MSKQLKSGNAIVRLLLSHGEKIAIIAILACVGLLVWASMGQERLSDANKPDVLESNARSAEDKVNKMSWQTFPEEEKLLAEKAHIEPAAGVIKAVPPTGFPRFESAWDERVLAPVGLRTDPPLLPPIDLEVNTGSGLWASADPDEIERRRLEALAELEKEKRDMEREEAEREKRAADDPEGRGGRDGRGFGEMEGGARQGEEEEKRPRMEAKIERPQGGSQTQGYEDIKSTSWAIVLARVPIQAESQLYRDALASARGYDEQRDSPNYKGYYVQRAEIVNGKQGEWQEIAFMYDSKLVKIESHWPNSSRTGEVIDPRFSHPLLTFPLPPMAVRSWGEDVTHSEMPLPSLENPFGGLEAGESAEPDENPEEGGDFFDRARTQRNTRRSEPGYGEGMGEYRRGRPGGTGREYGGQEYPRGRGGMGGEYGGGGRMGGEYGGRGGGGEYAAAATELPQFVWDHRTSHVLFRYFDNTVEPGRQYRYRVKLMLADVNFDAPVKTLDKTVSERLKEEANSRSKGFRFTEWSEPSPIANIPLPGLIYLAGGKEASANNYYDEPEARLIVKSLDSEHAAEVAIDKWYTRGSVINAFDKAKVIWADNFELEEGQEEPKFHFDTGMTLVDFYGGEAFERKNSKLTEPTNALLMDAAGRLTRRSELDALDTVESYEEILARPDDQSGGRGGFGGGEYGGEYGRGR